MTGSDTRRIALARVPGERVHADDFEVRAAAGDAALQPGQVRVRVQTFGLNAGLRTRLGTGASTTLAPAIDVGDTPQSDAIAVVRESRADAVAVGSMVTGVLPWAEVSVVEAADLRVLAPTADPVRHLTLLGHVGLTAYAGLVSVGGLAAGETVWIPAAAGGVGVCAAQFAQALGARVIASAGSDARLRYLRDELGVAHVVDRRQALAPQLTAAAPQGLDLYFDLVGGDHLIAALDQVRERGRIVLAGLAGPPSREPVLDNSSLLIRRRLQLLGYSVTDHPDARPDLEALVARAESDAPMKPVASVFHGFERLPAAFAGLLAGECMGRGIVAVDGEAG